MLDTTTLRVAFALVAVCVLVLFGGVTFRPTRSAYSGWWCASLSFFILSASLFVLNGTAVQVVANPLGNVAGTLGAGCVWAAGRSLRGRPVSWRLLAAVPLIVFGASVIDHPATNIWSGGPFYLAGMAVLIGGSAVELVLLLGETTVSKRGAQSQFVLRAMALVSGALGAFFLARMVAFVTVGPEHPVFESVFGGQVTTMLTMLLLVVVTFSMSTMSHDQQTIDLRYQATRDDLTGLLNRGEFLRVAQHAIEGPRLRQETAVIVADLDQFKSINDGRGHAAGDQALIAFAEACRAVVGVRGVIGRLGGDEFVLLVRGAGSAGDAETIVAEIAANFATGAASSPMPTVSFGIAAVLPGDDIALAVAYADEALYAAKAAGRARSVRSERTSWPRAVSTRTRHSA